MHDVFPHDCISIHEEQLLRVKDAHYRGLHQPSLWHLSLQPKPHAMTSRGTAAGEVDPQVAIEGQFEAERRFVDEWLLQLRDCSQELEDELAVPGSASVRPEDWAPCQARTCQLLHKMANQGRPATLFGSHRRLVSCPPVRRALLFSKRCSDLLLCEASLVAALPVMAPGFLRTSSCVRKPLSLYQGVCLALRWLRCRRSGPARRACSGLAMQPSTSWARCSPTSWGNFRACSGRCSPVCFRAFHSTT